MPGPFSTWRAADCATLGMVVTWAGSGEEGPSRTDPSISSWWGYICVHIRVVATVRNSTPAANSQSRTLVLRRNRGVTTPQGKPAHECRSLCILRRAATWTPLYCFPLAAPSSFWCNLYRKWVSVCILEQRSYRSNCVFLFVDTRWCIPNDYIIPKKYKAKTKELIY